VFYDERRHPYSECSRSFKEGLGRAEDLLVNDSVSIMVYRPSLRSRYASTSPGYLPGCEPW